jgi:aminoglycoside/choline kinase family phosphotransferase
MDSDPTTNESIENFIYFTNQLRKQKFSAPKIYGQDICNGLLLLEDLGSDSFANILKSKPHLENHIYQEAINQLIEIRKNKIPHLTRKYDLKILLQEAVLFSEWYLSPLRASYESSHLLKILRVSLQETLKQDTTLVLRDYHAENLMWLPDRRNNRRVGLLDYQDALAGNPAYDIASLLKDARREVPKKLQEELIKYFLKKTNLDHAVFSRDYSILSAQRNLKIIGIFSRLSIRDNKSGYLDLIPRVWKNLQDDLKHPSLNELSEFIKSNSPQPTLENLGKLFKA